MKGIVVLSLFLKLMAKSKKNNESEVEEVNKIDNRYTKILGLIFLFFSLLLFFSFISYLFTYKTDQSEVINVGVGILAESEAEVDNLINRLGALLGHFFIDTLFGAGAFGLVFIFFVLGVNNITSRKIFHPWKTIGYTLLTMSLACLTLGFLNYLLFPNSSFSLGGGFGEYLAGQQGALSNAIGKLGTGLFIAVLTLINLVWFYNIEFIWVGNLVDKLTSPKMPLDEKESNINAAPVNFGDDSIFAKDNISDNKLLDIEKKTEPAFVSIEESIEPEVSSQEQMPDFMSEINPEDQFIADLEDMGQDALGEADEDEQELEIVNNPPQESSEVLNTAPLAEKIDIENLAPYDPKLDLSKYKYPSLELLEEHGSDKIRMDKEELDRNKNQIVETLKNYNIEISKIRATIGPTVTLYEIVPAPGVRISKIKNLEDDIALSLAALGIRIIAPIPGKGTIGIEVPNEHKEVVSMRSILASEKFRNSQMDLPIGLGKNIANEIYIADLAKMPHLLMAGATGQGKSVGINSILISLLFKKHPAELKFVLVDPKKVELSIYSTIEKHFLAKLPGEEEAIITDVKKVVNTLNALCIEMDDRYELLKTAGVRNLKEYNHKFINRQLNPEKGHKFMPYIVLVIDEFADLIMTAGKEVEMPIARLAQLARAIGIHLILATQRPSVNIITGTIKANFPARISFKVASKIDSRTILDIGGAEQLIGRGDMLLSLGSDLIRLQCGFLDTPEVDNVSKFISSQQGYPMAFELPEYYGDDEDAKGGNFNSSEKDECFEEAARLIVINQMGSTSLIQRKMKLGYNRAGRIMDQLEQAGIVGPNLGSKARDVNFRTSEELERFLETIR
jgi:S-DNA-T family DNA segregation ATPase FtsK/SpoIIIE